jgi:hypothetical protein
MRARRWCFGGFEQGRLTIVTRHYLTSGLLSFDTFVQRPLMLLSSKHTTAVLFNSNTASCHRDTSGLLNGYMITVK